MDDFTDEAIERKDVREMMHCVKTRVDQDMVSEDSPITGGAVVIIRTKKGEEYSKRLYYVKGNPKNPMTMDDVVDKYKRCLQYSARPLSQNKAEEVIEIVANLEQIEDVAKIPKLLTP